MSTTEELNVTGYRSHSKHNSKTHVARIEISGALRSSMLPSEDKLILCIRKMVNNAMYYFSDVTLCDKFIKYCVTGFLGTDDELLQSFDNINEFIEKLVNKYSDLRILNKLFTPERVSNILEEKHTETKKVIQEFEQIRSIYTTRSTKIIDQLNYEIITQDVVEELSYLLWKEPDINHQLSYNLLKQNADWESALGAIEYFSKTNVVGKKNQKILPRILIPFLNIPDIKSSKYSGYHRSGWQFVIDNFIGLHSHHSPILSDTYLDRTFGWNYNFNSIKRNIPYVQPWIGFIHHVANENTPNNIIKMFARPKFIQSLPSCLGLITFSQKTKCDIELLLKLNKFEQVDVINLIHPTETTNKFFNVNNYNDDPNITQIGSWLRMSYPICALDTSELKISKNILIGKDMSDMIPNSTIITENMVEKKESILINITNIKQIIEQICNFIPLCRICHIIDFLKKTDNKEVLSEYHTNLLSKEKTEFDFNNIKTNRFLDEAYGRIIQLGAEHDETNLITDKKTYQKVHDEMKSVTVINKLTDLQYDEQLTSSVVFLCLTDANAVNTVNECIVRNTPILVNRLPALEEVLGKNYPMFYTYDSTSIDNTTKSISELLHTPYIVKSTHEYMKAINKEKFTMKEFLRSFLNSKIGIKAGMYNRLHTIFNNKQKFNAVIRNEIEKILSVSTIPPNIHINSYQGIINELSSIIERKYRR